MAKRRELTDDHDGRFAGSVLQIPLSGWKQILKRTVGEIGRDNITLIAGGATFFLLLAIFPALAAFVALYGLLADPSSVESQVAALQGVMPGHASWNSGWACHQARFRRAHLTCALSSFMASSLPKPGAKSAPSLAASSAMRLP